MVIYQLTMTNPETQSSSESSPLTLQLNLGSPGLPESEAGSPVDSVEELCSLPDEVFNALDTTLTPIIKEELRTTIRRRRIDSGMDELVIDDSPKPPPQMTPEEEEKRRLRRERNRLAALKCRRKRKESNKVLQEEWEEQQSLNQKLQEEVDKLEEEKKKLMNMMQAHRPSCIIKTQDAALAMDLSEHSYTDGTDSGGDTDSR